MIRYLAVATALVIGALVIATALAPKGGGSGDRTKYATATGTPGPAQHDVASHQMPLAVTGEAPWALSALPECFKQLASRSGPPAYARTKIARDARRVSEKMTLTVADCTLDVKHDSAVVTRGENRLTVPAVARFYVAGDHLVLERLEARHEDVRVYALATGRPSFVPSRRSSAP